MYTYFFYFLGICASMAQPIVIHSYYNASDVRNEWTELLITQNMSLVDFSIRDNTSSGTQWQHAFQFKPQTFLQKIQRGSMVLLHHRSMDSNGNAYPVDTNASDGYLELSLNDSRFFTQPEGSLNNAMQIASNAEIIQILDPQQNPIFTIGHGANELQDMISAPLPKYQWANSLALGKELEWKSYTENVSAWDESYFHINDMQIVQSSSPGYAEGGALDKIMEMRKPVYMPSNLDIQLSHQAPSTCLHLEWPSMENYYYGGYLIVVSTSYEPHQLIDGTGYTSGDYIIGGRILAKTIPAIWDSCMFFEEELIFRVIPYAFNVEEFNNPHSSRGPAYSAFYAMNDIALKWKKDAPTVYPLQNYEEQIYLNRINLEGKNLGRGPLKYGEIVWE